MRLSISRIKLFKSCRRAYQLRYIEGLEPIKVADALTTGRTYHEMLEHLYNGEELADVYTKERAMVEAYRKYIMPKVQVAEAEKWIEYPIGDDVLVGRIDGITADGVLVEHKTTGAKITEAYEYGLMWDEQVLAYMLMTGMRKVLYTICQKPTIKQHKDETEEEFHQRMIRWFDEDTDSRIRLLELTRTDEEIAEFEVELMAMFGTISHAERCGEFYKNPAYCEAWGRRCEYSSVCLHYDPSAEYIEFTRKEHDHGAKKDW